MQEVDHSGGCSLEEVGRFFFKFQQFLKDQDEDWKMRASTVIFWLTIGFVVMPALYSKVDAQVNAANSSIK